MEANVVWDGPVLSLINNRIRALQTELEDPISQDKPTILALIDELQSLREPLSSALAQQLQQHSPNKVLFRNCASFQRQVDGSSTSQPHDLEKIATNSGHATTLATTDAPTPTLRQIERATTPITYPPRIRDILLLIHEHLQASGFLQTASMLLKEAQLEPLSSLVSPSSLVQQPSIEETSPIQLQWPSGRVPGFLSDKLKLNTMDKDAESQYKNPIILPMKHKLSDLNDTGVLSSSVKRLNAGDLAISAMGKSSLWTDATGLYTPSSNLRNQQEPCTADCVNVSESSMSKHGHVTPSLFINNDHQPNNPERITLNSLVAQYLKHQHCQCQTHIATLPPLSLLHPYVCPELKRILDAPSNVTSRLATREFKYMYGGGYENRNDRKFVYSRFRRSKSGAFDHLVTCITFLGRSSSVVIGASNGSLKIVDYISMTGWELPQSHEYPLTSIQSFVSGDSQLCLSSSYSEVMLWDASSSLGDSEWSQIHLFEGCKARFSNSGNVFAALSSDYGQCEILLYDIQTCQLESKLSDTSTAFTGRGQRYSLIHFNHSDSLLLWNGVLWDRRVSGPVYRFDQSPDYGGGGFHPSGNEVIINSEVWDMRKFRLLRSVPSLDQTKIAFNARGDVIYATLRSSIEDYVMSSLNPHRGKHPLFAALRTVDAVNYSDIATIPMKHCVLDFATDPTDSFVGLLTVSQSEGISSMRIYEIGKQK